MTNYKINVVSSIILLVLDFAWLSLFMGKKYKQMINSRDTAAPQNTN